LTHSGSFEKILLMKPQEIAEVAGCTLRSAYNFLAGSGFSKKRAERLEAKTGVHRLHWLYPGQFDEAGHPIPSPAPQPDEAA
jgi:hypothetical protein